MKNKFTRIIVFIITFIVLESYVIVANAQACNCNNPCNTSVRALPKMWVSKELAKKRKDQLKKVVLSPKSKYEWLKDRLYNESPTFFIPKEQLKFLVNKITSVAKGTGLRIIFACYIEKDNPSLDLEDNQLILLFTATDGEKDYGKTYLIDNGGDRHLLTKEEKKNWIENYEKNVLPDLLKTIDPNHTDNQDASSKASDTKSIYYENERVIDAFDTEISLSKIDLKGVEITLSAYDENGKPRTKYDNHFNKNRLILQFDYIRNDETIFNFEDLPKFCCRKCKWEQDPENKDLFIDSKKGLDNGHLCPANCPSFQAP